MKPEPHGNLLFLLTAIFAVAHMDRHILSISLDAIGQEFTLSDTQLGLLSGMVFAAMFLLAGFPIARLAARGNKRNIVATSAIVWSLLTLTMSVAQNFTHLVLARLGVGLGEAGAVAPAHAMISDRFPHETRTSALAFFATGANVGVLLAFLVGGIVGQLFGWRWAFVLAGFPGLILALLLRYTTPDVRKSQSEQKATADPAVFRRTCYLIWNDRGLFHAFCGLALIGIVTFGVLTWLPTFIIRTHGMTPAQTGIYLALTTGIIGGFGTWYSGQLADIWGTRNPRWRIGIIILAVLLSKPLIWIFFLISSTPLALISFAFAATVSAVYWGPTFAYLHDRLPEELRPMGTAIFLFGFNCVGVGIGPTVIGLASETLFASHGQNGLRYSLSTIQIMGIWGLYHYWRAMREIDHVKPPMPSFSR
ncbi:spinster family MFS transporter [Phaeobacter gallaeciensis]|uniref:spinster family MFS transporter n=1 Tax=Phaeobacter gallaeciensis TaxID=60890 RepID=UPI0004248F1D|nr:MFS transporter [Phaeobacter gallaeciensis]